MLFLSIHILVCIGKEEEKEDVDDVYDDEEDKKDDVDEEEAKKTINLDMFLKVFFLNSPGHLPINPKSYISKSESSIVVCSHDIFI